MYKRHTTISTGKQEKLCRAWNINKQKNTFVKNKMNSKTVLMKQN